MPEADTALAAGVRGLISELEGADPGELRMTVIEGGASRQSFSVEAGEGDARRRWFVRRDPPGAADSFNALSLEHRVIGAAAAAGVPVPQALAFEPAGGRLVTAGLLMAHVGGTSVAPRVLRRDELAGARRALPAQLGAALAAIHSVAPGVIDGLPASKTDPAGAACDLWEAAIDEIGEPLPAVEAGLRRLRLNQPPTPAAQTLVHGDFRLGNLIVDGDGLAAVIDWELCHAGDPAEDIAWLCIRAWRFGNDSLPVAGIGELDALLEAYEGGGGTRPEPERLRWWEAMGNVKWAVICARQAHDHLTGARPSAELASLGRRICEPEWDLLELLSDPGALGREAPEATRR